MTNILPIQSSLRNLANPEKSIGASRFFKTEKGEYGEGDIFLGISVPDTRKIVKQYFSEMNLEKVEILLDSLYHEERLAGVLTLVAFSKKGIYDTKKLAEFYMSHVQNINNWDLVDSSAADIIGPHIEQVLTHDERVKFIDRYIQSDHLWTNRIIIIASFYQIKKGNEKLTFYIIPHFLKTKEDLLQKACGWMLREVGKRIDKNLLRIFLDEYAGKMPRTMLRYAIEHFSKDERSHYMKQ